MQSAVPSVSLQGFFDPAKQKILLETAPLSDQLEQEAPFQKIGDVGPFAHLVAGNFKTDAGDRILPVVLMIQPDRYGRRSDQILPYNNLEVDRLWQQTIHHYTAEKGSRPGSDSAYLISDQIGPDGDLQPFAPLFYCKFQKLYFQPPCPKCGQPLDLCKDEKLLASNSLKSYKRTLVRYLACPGCGDGSVETTFYIRDRKIGEPACVKDRVGLLKGFGELVVSAIEGTDLPCIECEERGACFGPSLSVLDRIAPFSFFPFHMLIFKGGSIHAAEFLALAGGAAPAQLKEGLLETGQPGRGGCLERAFGDEDIPGGFLFDECDERRYLEILYLKLSLLAEFSNAISRGEFEAADDHDASPVERLWVRTAMASPRLPFLYNFDLSMIRLRSDAPDSRNLLQQPPIGAWQFLGRLWFYALLVNRLQRADQVHSGVNRYLNFCTPAYTPLSDYSQKKEALALFAPENIFWQPRGKDVPPRWNPLWRDCLDLGGALLNACVKGDSEWIEETFQAEFGSLQGRIKSTLFAQPPPSNRPGNKDTDSAIAGILSGILERWQGENADPETDLSVPEKTQTDDPDRTLPLTAPATGKPPDHTTEAEDFPETLILSPGRTGPAAGPPDRPVEGQFEDRLEDVTLPLGSESDAENGRMNPLAHETVDLGATHRSFDKTATGNGGQMIEKDPLPETLILTSSGSPEKKIGRQAPDTFSEMDDEDLMTETVILRPKKEE